MKKTLILIVALLAFSGIMDAQVYNDNNDVQPIYAAPVYGVLSPSDYFYMMPLSDQMTMIYGSRYRRANNKLLTGVSLTTIVAPTCATLGLTGSLVSAIDDEFGPDAGGVILTVLGIAGTAASLGVGIPLWIKGRRELDEMLDDYSRRYSPRPNLSMGATQNGFGLALNF